MTSFRIPPKEAIGHDASANVSKVRHFRTVTSNATVRLSVRAADSTNAVDRGRGCQDSVTMGHHLFELPSGQGQLYVRDPGGNLVEVNLPHVRALSNEVRAELARLEDHHPQSDSNRRAHLYLDESGK
jgi:hypothetical protein